MKNRAVSAIPSLYVMMIILVYTLLIAVIFLELANASAEKIDINDADSNNKTFAPELVQAPCKSPCPPDVEMCIQMCA